MRQRRALNAARKVSFSATVSALALMAFTPAARSRDQDGTNPQRKGTSSRAPVAGLSRHARTGCVGATLYRGGHSTAGASNRSATSTGVAKRVKRPHMPIVVGGWQAAL